MFGQDIECRAVLRLVAMRGREIEGQQGQVNGWFGVLGVGRRKALQGSCLCRTCLFRSMNMITVSRSTLANSKHRRALGEKKKSNLLFRLFGILELEDVNLQSLPMLAHLTKHNRSGFVEVRV